jgi:hypothetical protein
MASGSRWRWLADGKLAGTGMEDAMSDGTARLIIGCAGSVSIDGQHCGRLTVTTYERLASLVPDGYPFDNFEHGDSLVFEMRLVEVDP